MDEKADSHDLLEAVETSEDEIRETAIARNPRTKSMGIRKHEKGLLENLQ